jgi:predicted RNA binding protein YcfA (HicA-like mRNA interferase family)
MKNLSGKEFAKIIEKNGWKLARVHGSHHIYIKENRLERISLPIHGQQRLKIGLLKHLIKIAGLNESDF